MADKFQNWFASRGSILVTVFFIILSVLSFATVFSARQTQDAIKKADLIVQCTTPGTQCYNLSQQQAQQRLKELKAASFCVVDAISGLPTQDWQANRDKLLAAYNVCVAEGSK